MPETEEEEEEKGIRFLPFTSGLIEKNVEKEETTLPDSRLKQGAELPRRFRKEFLPKHANVPLEEIDPFYGNEKTFVVIGRNYDIFRFNATKALWIFSPLSRVRQVVIFILVHPWFSVFINGIFLINCCLMMVPTAPFIMSASVIFTALYTFEIGVKVIARGLILQPFTYLRNPWNWLDFIVTILAYVAIAVDYTKLVPVASLRIFRLLKIATATSDLKVYTDIVIKSVIILKDMLIYAIFSLTILAILFLRIYMGVLTRKCVKNFPIDDSWGNLTDESWAKFVRNDSNWYHDDVTNAISLCGNSSDAQKCKPGYTCLEGYGDNPNNGYTNFDSFGWSFFSIFRLVTRDYWDNLYELMMASVGTWHVLFIIVVIFSVSLNLMNLIIASLFLSDIELGRKEAQAEEIEGDGGPDNLSEEKEKMEVGEESLIERLFENGKDSVIEEKEEKPSDDVNIIFNPFVELFVIFCIILNTIFLAMYHRNINSYLSKVLTSGNYFFTVTFGIEIIWKMVDASPKVYFKDNWNRFDFIVVAISMVGLVFDKFLVFSVLRSLSLLRLLQTPHCDTFNFLIYAMIKSLSALANLTVLMFIVIFIFAIIRTNLFGSCYIDNIDIIPKWPFVDFLQSFMLVFRIICGEWILPLWDCTVLSGTLCIPFFLAVIFIGNFVLRNLFLIIVLYNYSALKDRGVPDNINKFDLVGWLIAKIKRTRSDTNTEAESSLEYDDLVDSDLEESNEKRSRLKENKNRFWQVWFSLRYRTLTVIKTNHFLFKLVVSLIIVSSSVALAFEDANLPNKPLLQHFLPYMDAAFTGIFFCEMLIMWLGFGLKRYFKNGYYVLDFLVVIALLIGLGLKIKALKAVRVFRLLRIPGNVPFLEMIILAGALARAMRRTFCMLLLCLFVWLNFAIIGVHFFAGKYHECVGLNKNKPIIFEEVLDSDTCEARNRNSSSSPINFDNFGSAYMSLAQLVTFKGWLQIINSAADSRQIDGKLMREETNIYMYFYFIFFIIIGSFFTIGMFVGITTFSVNEATYFERSYHYDQWASNSPQMISWERINTEIMPKPKCKQRAAILELVTSRKFEYTMAFFVGLNLVVLAMGQYKQSDASVKALYYFTIALAFIFSTECLMKIFAFRKTYFKKFWNIFDLVVAVLSLVELLLNDYLFVLSALIRVIRLKNLKKLLKSMNFTQNIPRLFTTTCKSLPFLFSMSLLILLVISIYAIIGMFVFKANFQTFGQSALLLFQLTTWSGWSSALKTLQHYNQALVISYLLSYFFVCFIIFNLYFCTICQNHDNSFAFQDVDDFSEDDVDIFYQIWQRFDPLATKYIHIDQVSDFLDALEPPFRRNKPNKFKIVALDIPIRKGDLVLYLDILAYLIYDYFPCETPCSDVTKQLGDFKDIITSTLWRQRENYASTVIQNKWRRYKSKKDKKDG